MTELEKIQAAEIEKLNEELSRRDVEIKSVVLAIVHATKSLGIDINKLKTDGLNHIMNSGLIMKLMSGTLETDHLIANFEALAPIFEKYRDLVAEDLKLAINE